MSLELFVFIHELLSRVTLASAGLSWNNSKLFYLIGAVRGVSESSTLSEVIVLFLSHRLEFMDRYGSSRRLTHLVV